MNNKRANARERMIVNWMRIHGNFLSIPPLQLCTFRFTIFLFRLVSSPFRQLKKYFLVAILPRCFLGLLGRPGAAATLGSASFRFVSFKFKLNTIIGVKYSLLLSFYFPFRSTPGERKNNEEEK